jgi:hypothetical protein
LWGVWGSMISMISSMIFIHEYFPFFHENNQAYTGRSRLTAAT